MKSTIEEEIEKYQKAWDLIYTDQNECGTRHVAFFLDHFDISKNDKIVDLGCGSGRSVKLMRDQGFDAYGIDLIKSRYIDDIPFTQANLWNLPDKKFDYIFCTDVLEHIPTDRIEDVLDNMRKICGKGIFLAVATRPDQAGKYINETLHLTVQDVNWWLEHLGSRFQTLSARNYSGQEFTWTGIPL